MTNRTFLIMDNDPQTRDFFQTMLQEGNNELHFVTTEQEILRFIREKKIHLILINLQLPGVDGLSLLSQLRQQQPDLIRLAMSEMPSNSTLLAAINEVCVSGWLIKPLVKQTVERIFEEAGEQLLRQDALNSLIAGLQEKNRLMGKQLRARDQQLQLLESKAYIGDHALQLVHNLNSSLNNILNSMEIIESILSDEHPDLTDIVEFCCNAKCAAVDLQKLIAEILIHHGERGSDTELVDINALILKERKFLEINPLFKYEIDIGMNLQEDIPLVWANPLHLMQIIENLLKNSIDAIEQAPVKHIDVATNVRNNKVLIRIADTGEGIPEENLSKIFFPDFTTKPIGKGTGLGLASVKNLVDASHGEIVVQSAEGKGTEFIVALPIDRRDMQH